MTVHYFGEKERAAHEIYLTPSEDGTELIARYKHNDELVPESELSAQAEHAGHLYMWDLSERFYVVDSTWDIARYGPIKHTGLLNGRPALSAGKIFVSKGGAIRAINWSSGHYKPDIQAPAIMFDWMQKQGFNTEAISWLGWVDDKGSGQHWSREYCDSDWLDWSVDLPGFEGEDLKEACYQLTTSPSWMLETEFV